jgi:hypothetical protein
VACRKTKRVVKWMLLVSESVAKCEVILTLMLSGTQLWNISVHMMQTAGDSLTPEQRKLIADSELMFF